MVSLTDIYFLHRVSPGCGGCQNRSSTGVVYPGTRTLPEENSCIRPQWTLSRTGSDSCQCRSHCSFGPDDPQSRKTQGRAWWESILAAADIHFYVFFFYWILLISYQIWNSLYMYLQMNLLKNTWKIHHRHLMGILICNFWLLWFLLCNCMCNWKICCLLPWL